MTRYILTYLMIYLIYRDGNMKKSSVSSRTFGTVLWKMLGGRAADKRLAAQRLGVGVRFLNNVLQGRTCVSQRLLANKGWRDVLAKSYPAGWEQWSAEFDQCVTHFRVSRGYCVEPPINAGIGYVLWLILGG